MNAPTIAGVLGGYKVGLGWMVKCPAHDDTNPSLSVRDASCGVLVFCHAGCSQHEVIAALKERGLWGKSICDREHAPNLRRSNSNQNASKAAERSVYALNIWKSALAASATPVESYLASRGLKLPPAPSLRYHPSLKHPAGSTWPCMVSLVLRRDGSTPVAIHRTFIDQDGAGKAPVTPQKMMLGPCAGGAVRLSMGTSHRLVVCEGIETGLSLLSGLLPFPASVWAALSASGLKSLELPLQAGELIIATDGDDAGRAAGNQLARRAAASGWIVDLMPAPDGQDWNDVLQSGVSG